MSLDELRDDLKRNMAEAKRITTVQEMREHLLNTLWPFIEANLDVMEEIDDAVAELVDHQEDYLQPETAAVFAAVIQSSLQLAAELRKRAADDATLLNQITQHEHVCQQAMIMLGDVTMVASSDAAQGDGDESDEDEDADAESEEESASDEH